MRDLENGEKKVKVSLVFERNYDARTKVVLNQGSGRSGVVD